MAYLKISTNEYPLYSGDLELLGWKLGEPLPEDFAEVIETPYPNVENGFVAEEISPVLNENNEWVQTWIIREQTEQEKSLIQYRAILLKVLHLEILNEEDIAFLSEYARKINTEE